MSDFINKINELKKYATEISQSLNKFEELNLTIETIEDLNKKTIELKSNYEQIVSILQKVEVAKKSVEPLENIKKTIDSINTTIQGVKKNISNFEKMQQKLEEIEKLNIDDQLNKIEEFYNKISNISDKLTLADNFFNTLNSINAKLENIEKRLPKQLVQKTQIPINPIKRPVVLPKGITPINNKTIPRSIFNLKPKTDNNK